MAKLLSVEALPGRKKGSVLHFDIGDVAVPEGFAEENAIFEGAELTEKAYGELKRKAGRTAAMQAAARLLGSRQYSEREVSSKLLEKGLSEASVQYAVEKMKDIGAIDDALYAETLARHYAERGYGSSRIRDELYRRHIDRSLWEDALSGLDDQSEEIDAFIAKRLRDPGDRKEVKKVTDALFRRGFSWEEIRAGLRRIGETLEENR